MGYLDDFYLLTLALTFNTLLLSLSLIKEHKQSHCYSKNKLKSLNVNLEPEDIDKAHRMKKGSTQPKPIIADLPIITVGIDYT